MPGASIHTGFASSRRCDQGRDLVGSKTCDRPLDCLRLLRPGRGRGCADEDGTGASAGDETRDLAVAGSRRAIGVDHARASAGAKPEPVRTGDQTNVLRALLLTQVLDPEARPVRKRLRSLAGSCVEVAADAAAGADQRNRDRSRVGANRPPGPRVGKCRRARRKPGKLPAAWRGPRMQPPKSRRLTVDRRASARGAAPNTEDRSDGRGDHKQPPRPADLPIRYFHRRRWGRRCYRSRGRHRCAAEFRSQQGEARPWLRPARPRTTSSRRRSGPRREPGPSWCP